MKQEKRLNELKNCTKCPCCGWYPTKVKGKLFDSDIDTFAIACTNEKCKDRPRTENGITLRGAVLAWDRGIVTNYMF